ncbi:tyrosine-type recombinase/integrase [Nocardia terpenica]|uniref:tyrosine-type recombinase/integrase n=1 Tax=Nocardia terpenica TaxID=455432 RepID=UPI003A5C1449
MTTSAPSRQQCRQAVAATTAPTGATSNSTGAASAWTGQPQRKSRLSFRSTSRQSLHAATRATAKAPHECSSAPSAACTGHAERDGLILPPANPARSVDKPRQPDSDRHALHVDQVLDLACTAATTGDDPELDALIIRLHIETACRRSGVLYLDVDDLDAEFCLIKLREKGGTMRWQPISPRLAHHLVQHIQRRGGTATTNRLLRYRNGRPIGRRRYDTLHQRLRAHLPWAAALQVTVHWLRHTTLTYVEREFGYAIARAYAGHKRPGPNSGSTLTYVGADLVEVVAALEALTGEPHPLGTGRRITAPRTPIPQSSEKPLPPEDNSSVPMVPRSPRNRHLGTRTQPRPVSGERPSAPADNDSARRRPSGPTPGGPDTPGRAKRRTQRGRL